MKTILTLLLATLTSAIIAQDTTQFSFQISGGTSLSIPYEKEVEFIPYNPISGSSQTSYRSGYGYFVEVLLDYKIEDYISISSGLNYSLTSIQINETVGARVENKGQINKSYVNVPVLANYMISKNFPLTVSAGINVGFLISAKEEGTTYLDTSGLIFNDPNDPLIVPEREYNQDIKEDYYSTNFGLVGQLEYPMQLNDKLALILLSRFNYGLTNVQFKNMDNKTAKHNAADEWKNYTILLGVGLRL